MELQILKRELSRELNVGKNKSKLITLLNNILNIQPSYTGVTLKYINEFF